MLGRKRKEVSMVRDLIILLLEKQILSDLIKNSGIIFYGFNSTTLLSLRNTIRCFKHHHQS